MFDNDMENKTKMQSLMDLVSKMKELQAGSLSPKDKGPDGLAVEMHETHLEPVKADDPELAKLEEATHTDLDNDNEEGEAPEHQEAVLGSEKSHMDQEDAEHDDLNEETPDHEVVDEMQDGQDEEHEEELPPIELHPGLMKLLQAHLASKK